MMNVTDLLLAKYEKGGRGPDKYDCFGLFAELCRRQGLSIPDHPTPEHLAERDAAIMSVAGDEWVRLERAEFGCAVLLRMGPWVSHIGMVLDEGMFIHASSVSGITVARLDEARWAQRIAGFYRYTGGAN